MNRVQVLLSTYNGEKYICQQLDSILHQKDIEVSILIRDDGSTDQTLNLLHEYASVYPNVHYVPGKNCGVVASFFRLFELADDSFDFYALSDQDDVWDADKLKIACDKLSFEDTSKPLMYCCSAVITSDIPEADVMERLSKDDQAKASDSTIRDEKFPELIPDFRNALIENIARGAGIVMNPLLLASVRIPLPKDVYMHDWWLYLVASCFGTVIYDPLPHYQYRQHDENVLGATSNPFIIMKRRFVQSKTNKGHIKNQTAAFSRLYKLPEDKARSADLILNYQNSFKLRLAGIFGKRVFRQSKLDNFVFRILFFTNHL